MPRAVELVLDRYEPILARWLPGLRVAAARASASDGLLTWRSATGKVRYLVEEKRHLRHQDVRVLVEQIKRRRADREKVDGAARLLLVAPHVRSEQAAILERAGIDYVDLAGNAHLEGPGLFVHVEGHKPAPIVDVRPTRPSKAWVKTVMALLIRPELVGAPYRVLAGHAGVALGTVAACVNDLIVRGLLQNTRKGRRVVDFAQLVALWTHAYVEVLRPRLGERRFQVRVNGREALWKRLTRVLKEHDVPWALTGADAAERITHFFRAGETEIYLVPDDMTHRSLQKDLVAQPATEIGNLIAIDSPGPLAFPTDPGGKLPLTPMLLAYAELRYRGTEQALEAAELLLPTVLGDGLA